MRNVLTLKWHSALAEGQVYFTKLGCNTIFRSRNERKLPASNAYPRRSLDTTEKFPHFCVIFIPAGWVTCFGAKMLERTRRRYRVPDPSTDQYNKLNKQTFYIIEQA